jgi:hypothetical protein
MVKFQIDKIRDEEISIDASEDKMIRLKVIRKNACSRFIADRNLRPIPHVQPI